MEWVLLALHEGCCGLSMHGGGVTASSSGEASISSTAIIFFMDLSQDNCITV
jgi:hypothetical protein